MTTYYVKADGRLQTADTEGIDDEAGRAENFAWIAESLQKQGAKTWGAIMAVIEGGKE